MTDVDQKRLRELFSYDPATGIFVRIARQGKTGRVGDVAGTVSSTGYLVIKVDGKNYKAHRLAWLYVHGRLPEKTIDHANGVKTDNRLTNLREATMGENAQNKLMSRHNKSGFRGVSWDRARRKFRATIRVNRVLHHLGFADSAEEAAGLYVEARKHYHTFQPVARQG